jgi:hypothetical protein
MSRLIRITSVSIWFDSANTLSIKALPIFNATKAHHSFPANLDD